MLKTIRSVSGDSVSVSDLSAHHSIRVSRILDACGHDDASHEGRARRSSFMRSKARWPLGFVIPTSAASGTMMVQTCLMEIDATERSFELEVN